MFNLRIFTILSFIVMIFVLIGSVSATDLNDTGILSAGDDELVSVENDLDELSADPTTSTFSELSSEIGSGGNVTLTHDYYSYDGSGSTITIGVADSVIDGKGAVIDMTESNIQPFFVTASGVTFKNLTIKNAKYGGDGGAIYFNSSGAVLNCNFTNNIAEYGSSVYFFSDGEVTNCNFVNNIAMNIAGAIFFDNNGTVSNCNFVNNTAMSTVKGGGAIFFDNNGTVSNCNFVNNNALSSYGGAVFFNSAGGVANCNFTNNAANEGGAVFFSDEGSVSNCNFTDNSASYGGAIEFFDNGTVTNCNFVNNTADYGGAFHIYSGTVKNCNFTKNTANYGGAVYFIIYGDVTNCNFTYNNASSDGGAIYFDNNGTVSNCNLINNTAMYGSAINMPSGIVSNCNFVNNIASHDGAVWMDYGIVSNCNFVNNTAGYDGGAIYFNSSGAVENCNFTNNIAYISGGAIYFDKKNGVVKNCDFISNEAYSDGGAIIFKCDGYVENCNFTGNNADNGGAVCFSSSANGTVLNCSFTGNTAEYYGAVYFGSSANGTVLNCSFTGNTAYGYGGAVYFGDSANGTVLNCSFIGNTAYDYGGAVYFGDSSNVTLENCNFTGNTADYGGALYFISYGEVTNCNFTYNNASRDGGVIYFDDGGAVSNCNFTYNNASSGGAVYFNNGGEVSNCNFTYNNASCGGAVYFDNGGAVSNCYFTNNTANEGGAVYFLSGSEITNCNFTYNTADCGGAIYMSSSSVSNCNFTSNDAYDGGAIYVNSTGTVLNSNFNNNTASEYGGAISFNHEGFVENCNFTGNAADGGGAIYVNSNGTVSNCNFAGNTGMNGGGAVYSADSSNGTVLNCNFVNNTDNSDNYGGGAVYFGYRSNGTVLNCNFVNNSADSTRFGGGAIYFNSDCEVTDCNFTDNSASSGLGGAVYFWNVCEVTGCNFTGNTANEGGAIAFEESGTVLNCNFVNNTASDNGGAIAFVESGTVLNCNFANNTATTSGGAVYFSSSSSSGTVSNCNFTNNTATSSFTGGGAVYFSGSGNVSNCDFMNNTASRTGGAVYIAGSGNITDSTFMDNTASSAGVRNIYLSDATAVTLSDNTLDATVTIDSPTYKIGGEIVITGTVDAGVNFGFDNVTFTINSTGVANTSNITNRGKYSIDISSFALGVGKYNITSIENSNYTFYLTNSDNFTVEKTGSSVVVSVVDGVYNTTAPVADYSIVNETVVTFVIDDGDEQSIDGLEDALAALPAGKYTLTIKNAEDDNYNASETSATFTVVKASSSVVINSVTDGVYNTTAPVADYSIVNETVVTFVIDDGDEQPIGDLEDALAGLGAGSYTLTIMNAEGDNYNASEASKKFNVAKAVSDVTVNVDGVIYPNDVTIEFSVDSNATIPEDANVTILVADKDLNYENYSVSISDGQFVVSGLDAGNYTVDVIYHGDNNISGSFAVSTFEVAKANSSVVINSVADGIYNTTAPVVDYEVVNATVVTFVINDGDEQSIDGLEDALAVLPVGKYTLTIKNAESDNYNASEASADFVVEKAGSSVVVSVVDGVYNTTAPIVTFSVVNETVVRFAINNSEFIRIENLDRVLSILPAGSYNITIKNAESDNYNASEASADFVVEKAGSSVVVSVVDGVYNTTVPVATYTVVNETVVTFVIDDGEEQDIDGLDDALAVLPIGSYTLTIKNAGDDNYNASEASATFSVAKASSSVVINSVTDGVYNTTAPVVDYEVVNETVVTFVIDDGDEQSIDGLDDALAVLPAGNYTLTIKNAEGDNYNASEASATFEVAKAVSDVTVNVDSVVYPDDVTIEFSVDSNATIPENATVTIIVADKDLNYENYTVSISDGQFVVSDLDAGNYTVFVYYAGDDNIIGSYAISTFEVSVNDTYTFSAESGAIQVGDNATVSIILPDDATGTAIVSVGGENYTVEVHDGGANVDIPGLGEGSYNATVYYLGDGNYAPKSTTAGILVSKIPTEITAESDPVEFGDNVTVIVTGFADDATGTVTVTVDGVNYTAPVSDGTASVIISDLSVGEYTGDAVYSGDDKYESASTTVDINVYEIKIVAPDVVKFFSGSERFYVYVYGSEDNPLANKTVTITINGVSYTKTTDDNGTASLAINLAPGVYNVTSSVENKSVDSVVTVEHTVFGDDIVKMFRNDTQYYATFLDGEGNYLADGTAVEFNINGVFYTRYINGSEGKAKLNINLAPGEYIITANNTVTGEKYSNNITVLSRLVENSDLVKYYKNASQYTVKVIGDDGNAVGAGVDVQFNINGVIYTRQTNDSGIAKLNINLAPGDYVITAEYLDCKVSNNIKVLPVLTAEDITKAYGSTKQFVAVLVNGTGMPYGGQTVQFNINGVLYYRTTDSDGHAKLNINLMAGEYIITSSYNGQNVANTVTVTA